jgi:zinc/manganese transport system ATP-binding protein
MTPRPDGAAVAPADEPAPDAGRYGGDALVLSGAGARRGGGVVWSELDLRVGRGEFVAVLGPNGAGKSTLLDVILGLQPLSAGSVSVLGRQAGRLRSAIGYLPQRRSFDAATRIRGRDLVRLGLDGDRWGLPIPHRLHPSASGARRRVDQVVDLVGASPYVDRPIGELSGGEQQRLLIAQALVRRPQILLLDEPLDSLDLPNQRVVAALVHGICRSEGVTVLLVAHDVNPILGYLHRVVYLAGGRGVEGRPREVITSETLSVLYGTPIEVLETSDGRLVVVGTPEPPAIHSSRHQH